MEKTLIKYEDIVKLLPENVELTYVDYRDSLKENIDVMQECLAANNYDKLDEYIDEWYNDMKHDAISEVLKQLVSDLADKYDISEEEAAEQIKAANEDYSLTMEIEARDTSFPRNDLLRNTGSLPMEYSTGHYIEDGSWGWEDSEIQERVTEIKKLLSIETYNYDNDLNMMIREASYGGELVVFFSGELDDFITDDKTEIESLHFTNAHIGIINHSNGSGDICQLKGHSFTLPFKRENLFFEGSISYNWTYDIAGMITNWSEDTKLSIKYSAKGQGKGSKLPTSCLTGHMEQERQYEETYKAGKCTAGDMNINRHRDVEYINDFPCGMRCPHCGTFWID